jgi:DNA polymerase-3 subunit delta'
LLEQAVRVRYRPEAITTLPDAEAQFVKRLADTKVPFERLGQMAETISETIYYIERNAHSKTQLHALAIRLQYIIKGVEVPV